MRLIKLKEAMPLAGLVRSIVNKYMSERKFLKIILGCSVAWVMEMKVAKNKE